MNTHSNLALRIILGAVLVLLAVFSALPLIAPRAVSSAAPAARFSAGRAMADLQIVAREPHGAGSLAQARVRDYIIAQASAIGLKAEVQVNNQIANILVRLPGSDPTLNVLVTGHYDSHPPAPGAGDDGLSTVAMLEAMRVLHASPALRNDILFLFSDGEELGWLGARAFLIKNPAAKTATGVVLCFDGRPGNSPLTLRQTSPGDAWLARQMSGLPLSMWAGSWTNPHERSDQDTDFETFQAAGFTGVEIENEVGGIFYHTAQDSAERISPALVQSYGQTMLVLTNHFGSLDLHTRTKGPDVTYFSLPLVGLVAYPAWLMPILSSLGILVLLVFIVIGWLQKSFSPGRFFLSILGVLAGILLLVFCTRVAWGMTLKANATEIAAAGGFEAKAAWLAGMMIVEGLLLMVILGMLTRLLGEVNLAVAAALVFLLAGSAIHLLIGGEDPLTTAFIAWSFIGSVAGIGVLLFTKNPVWEVVLLSLSALLVMILMIPFIILGTNTPEDAWIPALILSLWVGLLAPQLAFIFWRAPSKDRVAL